PLLVDNALSYGQNPTARTTVEEAMQMNDMILMSVDDHICEPADMFEKHISPKFKGREPKIMRTKSGVEAWEVEGVVRHGPGLNPVKGRTKEEYAIAPYDSSQMRVGSYVAHARIDDMIANVVFAAMTFSSFPDFDGARFRAMKDKELALAPIQA